MSKSKEPAKRSPGRPKVVDQGTLPMRDAILRMASALFMEMGFEPVSVNQVAEKTGVTKASVYYYFTSKAELFTASVSEMMGRIRESTLYHLRQTGDLRTRLNQLAAAKLRHPHIEFESMMREAMPSLSEEQRERIRSAEQRIHDAVTDGFIEAMEKGEIAKANPLLLSHAFGSLLMMGNRASELAGGSSGKPLAEQIVDLFWCGISQNSNGTV
ncbi:TetR/AcrR family transcriptional regulator [Cohnella faecalis]|nr:TetR/AcrR family transcriptional regulator [Cohnella faecalis]